MSIDLTDRVCLITGAGRGIGEAVARGFAARGAVVVATDIRPPDIGEAALRLAWDVTKPDHAARAVEKVQAEFGRLDAFVANAGIYPPHQWDELGKHGVRINAILPGAVLTPGELEISPDQEGAAKKLADAQCLPHRLMPEGIEPTFAFLCSAESDAITGQAVCVDHGLIHW